MTVRRQKKKVIGGRGGRQKKKVLITTTTHAVPVSAVAAPQPASRRNRSRRLTRRQGVFSDPGRYIKTQTIQGLRWCIAALHPCSEGDTTAVGLPDENHLPTHCTRMQRTITVSPPDGDCGATGNLDSCTYNVMIVTTPWPEYPWLVCLTKGSAEPMAFDKYLLAGKYFANGDRPDGVMEYDTWYFYAYPNFMDTSRWVSVKENQTSDPNDVRKKYQKLRVVGKGTTAYLNASRLVDGGRVIAGQYPCSAKWTEVTNPAAFSLPMDKIMAEVKKALCAAGAQFSVQDIRNAAEHDHKVPAYAGDHTHDILKAALAHTHEVPAATLPPHSHNVNLTHSHEADVEKKIGSASYATADHTHSIDLRHSHDVDHNHQLTADQLGHKHKVTLPHDHQLPQGSHAHALLDTDERRVAYASAFINARTGQETATGFTDESLNLKLTTSSTNRCGQALTDGASTSVASNNTSSEFVRDVNVTVKPFEMESRTYQTQLTVPGSTTLESGPADFKTQPASVNVPERTTGRPLWHEAPSGLSADTCGELKDKEDYKPSRLTLVRDGEVEDVPDWRISEPPNTENALYYGDPKATTWPARKGVYQVLRLENTELQDTMTGFASFYDLSNTDPVIAPEKYSETFSLNIGGCGTWGVIYFRNISKAASVTLKSVQYTQGVANPKGPYANLTPFQIDPDKEALDMVAMENKRLAHSYYAEYNDLSKILGEIFGVAKQIGKVVKGASDGLSGVPIVGEVASALSSILGGLGL